MARILTKEQIDQITELSNQKLSYIKIAEITGISRITVARRISLLKKGELTKREYKEVEKAKLADQMANDRLTMSRKEVSQKYGKCESRITKILYGHPLEHLFKGRRPPEKNRAMYTKEQWDKAIQLRKQGAGYKEIAETLNMNYGSLKSALNTKMGLRKKSFSAEEKEDIYNQVAIDRLTMSNQQVADKWEKSIRWVNWVANERAKEKPDKPYHYKTPSPKNSKTHTPKVFKKKKVGKPEPEEPKIIIKDKGPERPVQINSKTTIYVKVDDKRTTEQIIKDYNKKHNL